MELHDSAFATNVREPSITISPHPFLIQIDIPRIFQDRRYFLMEHLLEDLENSIGNTNELLIDVMAYAVGRRRGFRLSWASFIKKINLKSIYRDITPRLLALVERYSSCESLNVSRMHDGETMACKDALGVDYERNDHTVLTESIYLGECGYLKGYKTQICTNSRENWCHGRFRKRFPAINVEPWRNERLPSSFQAGEQQDLANGDVSRTTGLRRALCIPRLSFRRVVDVACAPYNHIIKISNVPSTLLCLELHSLQHPLMGRSGRSAYSPANGISYW
ncbi:hypothetical protein V1478_013786 [Vespula squamosa]|uniref:Uncharacterized protein n=1 Tax=Vespula squamosa TaxID=30214 RepID=A0ABD2A8J3_VESSQ